MKTKSLVLLILASTVVLATPPGWENDSRATNDPAWSGFAKIAVDGSQNIHVVWQDTRDGNAEIYYRKMARNGTTLVLDTRLTSNNALSWYPAVTTDSSGNVHVVWMDERDGNTEIYYTNLNSNGGTVIDDTRITSNLADSAVPALAADMSGNLHVVWVEGRDGNSEIYYQKLSNAGAALTGDIRLTSDSAVSLQPSVAIDSTGKVHVVWTDDRNGNSEIYYTKLSTTGTTLADDLRLTVNNAESSYPAITRDFADILHVVWTDTRSGNSETFYKQLDQNGAALIADTAVSSDTAHSWFPTVSADMNRNVNIFWIDNRNGDYEVFFSKLKGNGAAILGQQRLSNMPYESTLVSVSRDTNNNLFLLWKDSRDSNDEVYYKHTTGPTLAIVGAPSVGNTIGLQVEDYLNPNTVYVIAFSFTATTGIPLGDGRSLPLDLDDLFLLTIDPVNWPALGLSNLQGVLTNGVNAGSWTIPNIPQLAGLTINAAFIALDPTLQGAESVTSISPAVPITLLP